MMGLPVSAQCVQTIAMVVACVIPRSNSLSKPICDMTLHGMHWSMLAASATWDSEDRIALSRNVPLVLTFLKGTETNRAATAPAVVSVITQLGYASVSLGTTGHVASIRRSWVRKLLLMTIGWSELFDGTRWYMLVTGHRIFFRWCKKNVVYSPREINLFHAWRSPVGYIRTRWYTITPENDILTLRYDDGGFICYCRWSFHDTMKRFDQCVLKQFYSLDGVFSKSQRNCCRGFSTRSKRKHTHMSRLESCKTAAIHARLY